MADKRGSAFPALTGANVANGDLFYLLDVSDTTSVAESGSAGTDKNITATELATALSTRVSGAGIDTSAVHTSDYPITIAHGGTGAATQQLALDALAGAVTNNRVLAGDATHVTLRALAVADLPTGTTSSAVPVGGVITAGGPQGDASHTQVLTWNAAGQVTAVTNTAIALDTAAITSGTLGVARGGTGAATLTAHGVVVGEGTSAVAITAAGTSGQLLIGQGASSDPSFNTMSGDVTITNAGVTTISGTANVESIIRANSLDQLTSPAANVDWNSKNLTGVATLTASTHQGSTSSGGTLTLNSTSNATGGVIGLAGAGLGTQTAAFDIVDVANATAITMNGQGILLAGVNVAPTATFNNPAGGALSVMYAGHRENATIQGTTGASNTMRGFYFSYQAVPVLKTLDTNAQILDVYGGMQVAPTLSVFAAGALTVSQVSGVTVPALTVPSGATVSNQIGYSATGAVASSGGTVTTAIGYQVANPGASGGTFTTMYGMDIALLSRAVTNIGIRTVSGIVYTPTVCTCTSNAATVTANLAHAKVTNTSAATCTITLPTTGAVSGQELRVSFFDATAGVQTVTFTNSETGKAGAPPTSLGSQTIPTIYRFMYNSGTSKWTYCSLG